MEKYREKWKSLIAAALREIAPESMKNDFPAEKIVAESPPDPSWGDIAFPLYPYTKALKEAPSKIGEKIIARLPESAGKASVAGPYLNISLDRPSVSREALTTALVEKDAFGKNKSLAGQRVMLEFSCPNTNKPLHLGHLRNDALGESLNRILTRSGAEVLKVNLINDRGIHICKSMLAYMKFGEGRTPETEGVKSDHFVGDYYVKFSQWAKTDPEAENQARALLQAWEKGDPETLKLWESMNRWAIDGIKKTYEETGISFDRYYFESVTYRAGREEILKGLAQGVFLKKEDGSIWVDLKGRGLDEKVLLRSDGTSLYVTQDVGTAVTRANDWPFDRMIYVVASEQNYHFQVLFAVLEMLKFPWANRLRHLAYGMVNLPEGKMKSREGTVVDADDLLEELTGAAREEIKTREREEEIPNLAATAKKISLGALNYFLLAATPQKDMIFDPQESLSFNGNTGPYLQYTGARLESILRKFEERSQRYAGGRVDYGLLTERDEWELVKKVASFPEVVAQAAADLDPSEIAVFLYDSAKVFAHYYHDHQILGNDDPHLVSTRIELVRAFRNVLKNGMDLIGVPFLKAM